MAMWIPLGHVRVMMRAKGRVNRWWWPFINKRMWTFELHAFSTHSDRGCTSMMGGLWATSSSKHWKGNQWRFGIKLNNLKFLSKLKVYGDGRQTRSFQFVSDLIDGLIALMNSNTTLPVNIGNPEEYSILEFAQIIRNLTGSPIKYNY